VYSSDFPWRIDFAEEMPEALASQQLLKFPSGSLTGMTMLYGAVRSGKGPVWLDPQSNRYWRPLDAAGVPKSTDGFQGWHRYDAKGDVVKEAGNRYLLSVMLGVTAGRGNSVPEIVRGLESSAAADGTKPPGTIYFVTNDDVRTKTRSPAFPPIVEALEALGVKAEVVSGVLPSAKRDVAGLMTGAADFDWPASKSTIVPGAICENLTSFGGIFTPSVGQTPLFPTSLLFGSSHPGMVQFVFCDGSVQPLALDISGTTLRLRNTGSCNFTVTDSSISATGKGGVGCGNISGTGTHGCDLSSSVDNFEIASDAPVGGPARLLLLGVGGE
jgi:prepilin-type processing-associated H-X9-DG protein